MARNVVKILQAMQGMFIFFINTAMQFFDFSIRKEGTISHKKIS
ncbi:hypothetical protein EV197_0574 [Aquimarina brevivitae]|uniref:Uncharacterized protein n=1 Tax=Aquimarina brevivitae TaxID=323412 RepID=A0A4Q7PFW0_9FLAO|nr:hypothetical protein EV197_0574 [Aquimarina brevivitae]